MLAWGGSFAAIKALVDHGLEAPDVAIGRYLVAAPGFGIALAAAGGMPGLTRRDALRVVAAGLFVVTVYHLALNAGERTTTAKPLLGRFDPVAVVAATSLVGTAALLPFGASGTAGRLGGIDAGDLALVVFLGLICTLAGYLLWTIALRFLDPSRAVAYLCGVPVVAVTVGAVTLGESVTGWLVLGGLLVVGGVALSL